jgi:soluble lytic murein transglycosylase-like protein
VLGLIQVESNFRKFAVSNVGARGYMQVMPFWTRVIGDGDPASCSTCRPTCASAA